MNFSLAEITFLRFTEVRTPNRALTVGSNQVGREEEEQEFTTQVASSSSEGGRAGNEPEEYGIPSVFLSGTVGLLSARGRRNKKAHHGDE